MMHPFATGSSVVTLARHSANGNDSGHLAFTDSEGNVTNVITTDASLVGSHFLSAEEGEQVLTKIELDTSGDMEVVVKSNKKGQTPDTEKKVCLWPIGSGATCGKTFTKFDSLKRHLAETHKGVRPYACTLCDKTYGRRDYLQRHLKSHNATYAVNLASASGVSAAHVAQAVNVGKTQQQLKAANTSQPIVVQVQDTQGGGLQLVHQQNQQQSPSIVGLPFLNLGTPMLNTKPMGSKICRWVQNDGTVCGKAFSKLDSLRRHVNELHKGVRPFACNLCEKSYGRRDYLDRHLKVHDPENQKKKVLTASTSLAWGGQLLIGDGTDLEVEDGEPPPPKMIKKKRKDIPPEEKKICLWVLEDGTACGKTFTKFDSLKRHVSEAHKGVRPFACSLCGKSYGRRDYLIRHLKSHNDADVAAISTSPTLGSIPSSTRLDVTSNQSIGQALNSSLTGSHSSQMLSTESVNAFVQSPRIINVSGTLNVASSGGPMSGLPIQTMRLSKKRLDDKKTCRWVLDNGTICGKTFSKFDSLRRHVQELHKGIRPFSCDLCGKNYGRRDYLERHMKTHNMEGGSKDSLIVCDDQSGNCNVSVCGEDIAAQDIDDDPSLSPSLTNVVTVITSDV